MSKKTNTELNIENEEYIKKLFNSQKNKPIYKMLWPEETGFNSSKSWNERFISVFQNINNYKIFKKFIEGKRWNYNDFNKMNNFIKDLFEMNFYDWRDFSAFIYSKQYRKYVEKNYSYFDIFDLFNIDDEEKNNDTFFKWSNLLDKAQDFLDDKEVPSGADPLLYIVYLKFKEEGRYYYKFIDYIRGNPYVDFCYIFGEYEEIYQDGSTEDFKTDVNYMEYVMLDPRGDFEGDLENFPWSKNFLKDLLESGTINDFIGWEAYDWKYIDDPEEIKEMLIERKEILQEFYDNYETKVATKKKIIYNSNSAANSNNNVDDENSNKPIDKDVYERRSITAENNFIECFDNFMNGYREAIKDYNAVKIKLFKSADDKKYCEIIKANPTVLYSSDEAFNLGYKTVENIINEVHTGGSSNSSNISHNIILGMIVLLSSVLGIQ